MWEGGRGRSVGGRGRRCVREGGDEVCAGEEVWEAREGGEGGVGGREGGREGRRCEGGEWV